MRCLLLEHGCEKTHNDYFRQVLRSHGYSERTLESKLGYASLQADGGVTAVREKVDEWFRQRLVDGRAKPTTPERGSIRAPPPRAPAPLASLGVGLLVSPTAPLPDAVALAFGFVTGQIGRAGLVIIPMNSSLLHHPTFLEAVRPRPITPMNSSVLHTSDI